jgi:hypothetical protein
MPRPSISHSIGAVLLLLATSSALVSIGVTAASATPTSFTAGDLVVDMSLGTANTGTSNVASAMSLVDYSTSGTPSGFAVNLPTTQSGTNLPLLDFSTYENGGLLTDSGDGGNLVVAGYGTSSTTFIGSAAGTDHASPDVVGIVGSTGKVDTSTEINDSTNNTHYDRSATIPTAGLSSAATTVILSGSQDDDVTPAGSDDTSTSTYLTGDNGYDLQISGGNLYESASSTASPSTGNYIADGSIDEVGTGLPTPPVAAKVADTPLIDGYNAIDTTHFAPEQFALLTVGGVSTIYVADSYKSAGVASSGGAVEKYVCTSSCSTATTSSSDHWTFEGYVPVGYPTGLAAVATASGANIYVTGGSSSTATTNTTLYAITDSCTTACATTSLTGDALTTLATAPSGDFFHGLAWAPTNPAVPSTTPILPTQVPLTLTSTTGTAGTALTLSSSGGSGTGAVSYAVSDPGTAGCTITGGGTTLSSSTAGTCTVTVSKASDGNYAAASSAATTVTFALAAQAPLTVTSTTGSAGTPLTLSYSGGSGAGAASYAVTSAGTAGCTLTGGGTTLSAATAGTCAVDVTVASDGTYAAATSPAATVTFALGTPAPLLLTSTAGFVGTPLSLTSSGGSGTGAVSYAVTSAGTAGCTLTGGGTTLTAASAGTCAVTVTQASDGTYAAGSSATTTVTFTVPVNPNVTVTSTSGTVGTPLVLTFSGGLSTGAVSYAVTSAGSAGCTLTGGGTTLTASSAGTCTVTATKAADANYGAVSSAPTTITFVLATQPAVTLTSTTGTAATPLTLSYSGGAGSGAVSYAVTDPGTANCAITGGGTTLTAPVAGTCAVTVTVGTDGTYAAATSAPTTVTFALATPAPLVLTSISGTVGTPLTLSYSGGSSSGALSYAVTTAGTAGCTLTGNGTTLTASGAGTCQVTVAQAGDATYAAVTSPATTVTFVLATQVPLALISTSGTDGVELTLTTVGGSSTGGVTYAVTAAGSAGCVVTGSGTTLSATSAGTCTVTATKAGDATYAAVTSPATTVTFAAAPSTPSAADAHLYTASTPQLATITDGTFDAPWNEYQGDPADPLYASQSPGTVLPTYTPGGTTAAGSPNLAVFPGASSGTDGSSPYPAGVVGTPGTLDGYCGTGDNTTASAGTPQRQPVGTTLPLAPAYFPHIVRNADGSLTGYFDYRPKDADEAIVAATSTNNGVSWTYDSEALEENPGYCPSADITDDGEGHPNAITVGGTTRLYTLPRAAGDTIGTGMLVHTIHPTESNPLAGAPATEKVGIDPDDFASSAVTVPYCSAATPNPATSTAISADPPSCSGSSVTIPFTNPVGTGSDALVAGEFVDATATPTPTASDVIYCSGVTSSSLTGCITNNPNGIAVSGSDVVEQVIGVVHSDLAGAAEADSPVTDSLECNSATSAVPVSSTSATTFLPCDVPQGPNTTNGDGGLAGFLLYADPTSSGGSFVSAAPFTAADDLTMNTINNTVPMRLYIDGTAVYCTGSNFAPSTEIENCTTGPDGSPLKVSAGDPVISDPIVPATAEMTTGLVAPDGIVGVLPSYPGAPAGATIVMYTEKVLNYFDVGYLPAGTFGALSSMTFTDFPNSASAPLTPVNGVYTVTVGDFTAQTTVTVTCTGYTTTATTGTLTGCTNNAPSGSDVITSKSFVMAPGATAVPLSTLETIGEGKSGSKSGEKNFGNNEDLTVLRVAYTTDGVNFSTAGLANDGIISGGGIENGSSYNDISNPDQTASPSNLNAYAPGDADATEMRYVGSAGTIVTNPDGSYGLFLSGAWAADGDSDAFNQIFYSTSTNGETWSTPVDVVSTDYTFAASVAQDAALASGTDAPLGISAYYSGRAYAPTVVTDPGGGLTMLFAGDRVPKSIATVGSVIGTNPNALYTVGANDPALYRNILAVNLTAASSPLVGTSTTVSESPSAPYAGEPVTYTATVAVPAPGTGTPSGSVTFSDGAGTLCSTVALSLATTDTASCTTTYTGPESDTVTATYSGDSNYATSSGTTTVNVISPLTLTKSSTTSSFSAVGQTITYSYLVGNATGVAISGITPSDNKVASANLSCPSSTLAAGASETCTGSYTTTQADLDAGSVTNTATVSGTDPSGDTVTSTTATLTVTAVSSPQIGIVKSASVPSYSSAGTAITYSYLLTNAGNVTLHAVGVADAMAGLSAITCPATTLAPGASETCTATYATTAQNVAGGSITNTATASGTSPSGTVVTAASSVTVPLLSWPTPAPITYGTALSATQLDASASVAGTFTYSVPAGAVLGAGTYPITATFSAGGSVSTTLVVTKAPLTITASSGTSTYGATPAAVVPNYSGLVNGDTAPATAPTCTTTVTSTTPVGTYSGADTCSGASDPNYTFTYVAGSATVTPAALTVTAPSPAVRYGAAPPTLTPTYTGFVSGDTASSLSTSAVCSTTATAGSPVGTYPVTCAGAADANYAITYVSGTVTVGTAVLTVAAPASTSTYGSAPGVLTPSYSGFVNGDTIHSLATPATCSSTVTASSAVGTYAGANSCSGAADPNYAITYVAAPATVTPATLTVTASSGSSTYGWAPATVIAGFAGFVNNDTLHSALSTQPVCGTTATASSPVGSYPATCSGAVASNYAITYVAGTATVTPAALTVTASSVTSVYGTTPPAITPNYTGLVNGDTSASFSTAPVCSTTATAHSTVGTYPTVCSGAVDPNYAFTYVSGSATVTKATPVITWPAPASVPAGTKLSGAQLDATASYLGVTVPGTFTYSPPAGTTLSAGTTPLGVTFTPSDGTDYTTATGSQSITVTPSVITVAAANVTLTFGAPNPATFTATVSGGTVTGSPSCSTQRNELSPAGTYPITCTQGTLSGPAGTTFTFTPGTLTVTYSSACLTGTINGGLTVGGNQAICIGAGATINGPVNVAAGGSLDVEGGRINGAVTAIDPAATRVCGATIQGAVTVDTSNGAVWLGDGSDCAGNVIYGAVVVYGATGGVLVMGDIIDGPLTIDANAGGEVAAYDFVVGNITLGFNSGGLIVTGDTAYGALTVVANNASPFIVTANTVYGGSTIQ